MTRQVDDMTRIEALRALLAAHEPVADDRRGGHRYIYREADARLRKGLHATRKARVGRAVRRVAS